MTNHKIIFYGDSNTYGFDPRGFSGGRYPDEHIWTSLLSESLGPDWVIVNEGMNGRRIPFPGRYDYVERLLEDLGENDYFAIMLGSNDILMTEGSDAEIPIRHMDSFLKWLTARYDSANIIVIAPIYAGSADAYEQVYRHFHEESIRMNEGFSELAGQYGCVFLDASGWGVETAYDMLHFSENGHRIFAENLFRSLDFSGV